MVSQDTRASPRKELPERGSRDPLDTRGCTSSPDRSSSLNLGRELSTPSAAGGHLRGHGLGKGRLHKSRRPFHTASPPAARDRRYPHVPPTCLRRNSGRGGQARGHRAPPSRTATHLRRVHGHRHRAARGRWGAVAGLAGSPPPVPQRGGRSARPRFPSPARQAEAHSRLAPTRCVTNTRPPATLEVPPRRRGR